MLRLLLLFCVAPALIYAQGPGSDTVAGSDTPTLPPWNFMSLKSGGIPLFLQENPEYDGRGTVVLILDTGVDPSIPGLTWTSTGSRKVIATYDVAHNAHLPLKSAEVRSDRSIEVSPEFALTDFDDLSPAPVSSRIWIATLPEASYTNAGVSDLDGDGLSETDFHLVVYGSADGLRVAIDGDQDGSLRGETGVRSFGSSGELLYIPQADPGEREEAAMTFGLQPRPDPRGPLSITAEPDTTRGILALHYDLGSHGTHVAGIAAGNDIAGEEGFDGVAPGAEVISIKISDDFAHDLALSGSMRRAYTLAARLADSFALENKPVILNMSFGIGSAREGEAAIEQFLDSLIPHHPNLYVVTSAGNEGPGLSSIGIPAAAQNVISVGAALPAGIGRDEYGALFDEAIIWDFSSRGGEVPKPDLVGPGTAVSTIPRFDWEMKASGTSMASPYVAGVVSLLMSGVRAKYPDWQPGTLLIQHVLRQSASPIAGYTELDQGGGMVEVNRAWELLQWYHENDPGWRGYHIRTPYPGGSSRMTGAAFWRAGSPPPAGHRQMFTLQAQARVTAGDFRAFTLSSDADWLEPVQQNVYMRDGQTFFVDVAYHHERLQKPGLYTGIVTGRRARSDGAGAVEFELLNTVIVPARFSPETEYRQEFSDTLVPGSIRRHFIASPSGASAIRFTLEIPKRSHGIVSGWIIDSEGRNISYLPRVNGADRFSGSHTVTIEPRVANTVLEVIVQAEPFEGTGEAAPYRLEVEPIMVDFSVDAVNSPPGFARVRATATGTSPIRSRLSSTVKGYGWVHHDTLRGERLERNVSLNPEDGALWISVEFEDEAYMQATDILARIVDSAGNVQAQEAFNQPYVWLFHPNFAREEAVQNYTLEIIFGAAEENGAEGIPVRITEQHVRPTDFEPIDDYGDMMLLPQHSREWTIKLPDLDGMPDDAEHLMLDLQFESNETPINRSYLLPIR